VLRAVHLRVPHQAAAVPAARPAARRAARRAALHLVPLRRALALALHLAIRQALLILLVPLPHQAAAVPAARPAARRARPAARPARPVARQAVLLALHQAVLLALHQAVAAVHLRVPHQVAAVPAARPVVRLAIHRVLRVRLHRHPQKPQHSQQQHMPLYLVMHRVVTYLPFLTQSEQVKIITVAFYITVQSSVGETELGGNWVLMSGFHQHGLEYRLLYR
jgi:hypothetical protein